MKYGMIKSCCLLGMIAGGLFVGESWSMRYIDPPEGWQKRMNRPIAPIIPYPSVAVDTTKGTLAGISYNIYQIDTSITSCAERDLKNRNLFQKQINEHLENIRHSLIFHYKNADKVKTDYGVYLDAFNEFWLCGPNELEICQSLLKAFQQWLNYTIRTPPFLSDSEIDILGQKVDDETIFDRGMNSTGINDAIKICQNRQSLIALYRQITAKLNEYQTELEKCPSIKLLREEHNRNNKELKFLLDMIDFSKDKSKDIWKILSDHSDEIADKNKDLNLIVDYLQRRADNLNYLTKAKADIERLLREVYIVEPESNPTLSPEELKEAQDNQEKLMTEVKNLTKGISDFKENYAVLFPEVPTENRIPPPPGREVQYEMMMRQYSPIVGNVIEELHFNTSITHERVKEMKTYVIGQLEMFQEAITRAIELCVFYVNLKRKLGSGDDSTMTFLLTVLKDVHKELHSIRIECELWEVEKRVEQLAESIEASTNPNQDQPMIISEDSKLITEILKFLIWRKIDIISAAVAREKDLPLIDAQTKDFLNLLELGDQDKIDILQAQNNSNALQFFRNMCNVDSHELRQYTVKLEISISKNALNEKYPIGKLIEYKSYIDAVIEEFDKLNDKVNKLLELNRPLLKKPEPQGAAPINIPCVIAGGILCSSANSRPYISPEEQERRDIEEAIRRSLEEQ